MSLSYLDFTTGLFHYIGFIFLETCHMNESISDVIKIVLGFLSGYFGHVFKAKYENRIINFKQRVNSFVVGNSIESEDWGDISVFYRKNRANNLYSVTIEIFNESNFGYSDLELEIAFPQGCVIYQFQAFYVVDDTKHKKILQKDQFFKYFNEVAERWSQEFNKIQLQYHAIFS